MKKHVIAMIVLFLVFVAGGWRYVSVEQEKLLQVAMNSEKERVAEFIRAKASTLLDKQIFTSTNSEEQNKAFTKFWEDIQSPDYIRIKIWNDNYTLIWADLKESIGQRFPDNHEMEEALEGEIELEIESLGGTENETERQFFKTAEVYIPIYGTDNKNVIGVVEVYKTAYFVDETRGAILRLTFMTAIVLLTAYGIIGTLMYRYFHTKKDGAR